MALFNLFDKSETGKMVEIPLEEIHPSRYQPRSSFRKEAMEELTQSIAENGLITPITVRKTENGYELIAGERRYRACKTLKFETIPCYILDPKESQAAEMAVVENVQRENLSAIEEAIGYQEIIKTHHITQEMLAKKIGKSQSAIANKLRLLNLEEAVQEQVKNKQLSERQARALLAVPKEKQATVAKTIVNKNLNVKETEAYIEKLNQPKKAKKKENQTKGYIRNIKIAVNTVNQCVEMIQKMGIKASSEIKEKEEEVAITIHLPK